MISFFGNYYGGLVVKNIEKVFYMICGVALVFVGIIIGGLIENDADAQTEPGPEYYKVVTEGYPNQKMQVQDVINEGCKGGYVFHQMVVTNWDTLRANRYDRATTVMLIFKKK